MLVSDALCPAGLNSLAPNKPGSLNDLGDWQQEDRRPADVTPDGRFIVFTSSADLTPDDKSSVAQVFEYDADTGTLVRVSAGQDGFNNDGNTGRYAALIAYLKYSGAQNPAPRLGSVSDNGSDVVFQSNDALTPQAAEGVGNVYEYHAGEVSLISDGQDRTSNLGGEAGALLLGMDGSGADVFFKTADQLVPQDGDTQVDVYDARREGGFPAPAVPSGCVGEGCQGTLSAAPSFLVGGSASQPPGENVIEPPPPKAVKAKSKLKKKTTTRAKRRVAKGGRASRKTRSTRRSARHRRRAMPRARGPPR